MGVDGIFSPSADISRGRVHPPPETTIREGLVNSSGGDAARGLWVNRTLFAQGILEGFET